MGFRKGAFATVWKIDRISDSIARGQISTSHKVKDSNSYEQDFGAYVSFIGTATAAKALKLNERDRIRLGDVDVTTKFDKEKNQLYTNFRVFSFESPDEISGGKTSTTSEPDKGEPEAIDVDDSNLPF